MNKKRWLILAGVVIIAVVGAVITERLLYVREIIEPVELEISYATTQTEMPAGATCAGGSEESPGIAKEILNLETDDIFVAGGSNPMPDAMWEDYRFRLPYLKNSTRNLLFTESCFFRSPDAVVDCQGDNCFTITEIVEDHTWLKLTTIAGQGCYPNADGCNLDDVEPGYISITTIAKCHRLVFEGPTLYELADGRGNRYVMHATATGTPDITGPQLPEGWTLTAREISEPLVLLPFGGGDHCYYNVVRDNLVQSYHQIAYADEVYPPETE
ncbi:MAG: hypothetical protein HC915_15445 [Anaerolineae bacterium]|nr:hypothetical protein [Anaerolineae bacterium]